MSDVVTATRQVIQALLAPGLRELRVRIQAVEVRMDRGFKEMGAGFKRMDEGFSEMRLLLVKQMDFIELREPIARVAATQAQRTAH